MAEQIQKPVRKQTDKERQEEAQALAEADAEKQAEIRAKGEGVVAITDEFLDEIDALLEEQAEEFVRAFQQKGGE